MTASAHGEKRPHLVRHLFGSSGDEERPLLVEDQLEDGLRVRFDEVLDVARHVRVFATEGGSNTQLRKLILDLSPLVTEVKVLKGASAAKVKPHGPDARVRFRLKLIRDIRPKWSHPCAWANHDNRCSWMGREFEGPLFDPDGHPVARVQGGKPVRAKSDSGFNQLRLVLHDGDEELDTTRGCCERAGDGEGSRLDRWEQVEQVLERNVGGCVQLEVFENLEHVSPRPVAIFVEILLALGCCELDELLLLRRVLGEVGQQLEEIPARNRLKVEERSSAMAEGQWCLEKSRRR